MVAVARGLVHNIFLDAWDDTRAFARNPSAVIVAVLVLAPWVIVLVTGRNTNPWPSLAMIFGIMLVYWVFTRRSMMETLPVYQPLIETAIALGLVLIWMLFRIGQYTALYTLPELGVASIRDVIETIVPKLLEMVVIPLIIWLALGYRPGELGIRLRWRDWLPAGVLCAALIFEGLRNNSPQEWWDSAIYFYLGAGLPEEFLFRAILQPRLEVLTRSPIWGLYLASLVFGMSHLPINLSNADPSNWISAFESAFTFQLSVGFALGFAFQRVRSILPLTVIHALVDAAP